MAKLGEICLLQSGGTPARSNAEYWANGTIPWVKISDIEGKHLHYTEERITKKGLENSSAKVFPKGTILYTIFATLGEVCFLDIDAATNQAIVGLQVTSKDVLPDYLYYFLLSKKEEVNKQGRGVAQNNINMSILKEMEVVLCPLAVQQKIVKQLDKVSDLIALRKQQLAKLDELVKSRFIEMFGDPKDNPNGYAKRQLKETCMVITGNTPSRAVSEYYGEHIEWIKTDNIVSGLIHPTPAVESLSEKGMAVSRTVEKNSILMACIAGSITSIGRVCVTDRKVAFNQQINAIVPGGYNVLFLYVLLQISKEYLVEEINMALKGILSKSKLEEKSFIVPPLELQEQFATFVEQTDKSKLEIQTALTKLETLKKALMQQYFG